MTERHNAPRRYFVDAQGKRVLIGLSLPETAEFEALDITWERRFKSVRAMGPPRRTKLDGLSFIRNTKEPGGRGSYKARRSSHKIQALLTMSDRC